ncbi:MAP KINASE KINASE KINASE SSK2-RELATED-RELATED [Salix purpurea]|uniref:mitogen-activated protein kinase kinase kinase n=1 Tax=Salix purpurea TaxID=77065 RepID=A0A9Q0PD02_SALPP|nr:MAP KINASE KINASE KINASE SSK2-RELATED-RELATED [Salix purpurea]
MHFFSKTCSSSSFMPSSPFVSSPKDSSSNCHDTAGNSGNTRGQSFMQKKLERKRNFRHVSEQDLGLDFTDRPYSPPADPDSAKKSLSPGGTDHWSSAAVPHPLPLPESLLTWRRESSVLTQGHLGSSEEGPGHVLGRSSTDHIAMKSAKPSSSFRQRFSRHAIVESTNRDIRLKIPPKSAPTSGFSSPTSPPRWNATDLFTSRVATELTKSPGKSNRVLSNDVNVEGAIYKFRGITYLGITSPKSAPTSGPQSPATAIPQRSYTGDFLPTSVETQVQSTLEIPDCGRIAGHSSLVPPAKSVFSPDRSPHHSPTLQSPYLNPKNYFSFLSHHKLCQKSSKEWPESSHASAHPLPLPPKTAPPQFSISSPPTVIHNTLEKLNVPFKKNQWVKGRLIGSGTYGRVYIGTNRETGASCAMKEVNIIPEDPKSAECIKQLEQEIRVLRDLKHPNIVQYYGSEIVDDHFYIYLEYINPGSINRYVRDHCGHMTESIVRNFTRHILSGLAYLHSTKTVHRDIKGANLLVDASGVVKLTDFGTAKHLTGLSYELSLKGSPHWMAPEVIKAVMRKDCNPELALAVDIWSLGCAIIEMFTGKPPWGDLQGAQAMFKILYKDPPMPETLSAEGKDFLRRCFLRNPAERPSAMALLEHPFVCKSSDLNVSASTEAAPAANLTDNSQNLRESTAENDVLQTSPGMRMRNHQLPSSSETSHRCNVYTFCHASTSHHPPCSALESRPYISTAQLVNASNHPLALFRSHGREIPHL